MQATRMNGHANSGAAGLMWAIFPRACNLALVIHLVVLQHSQLHRLMVVLGLLGFRVGLLLSLFGTTTKAKHEVQSRLLLDVVVGEGAAVLELLTSKDEALLVGGDALLVLDLGLDVVNGVAGLDLERDSLTRQGLDEDLVRGGVWEQRVSFFFRCPQIP